VKFNNRCASAGFIDLRTQIFDIFEMKKSVVNLTLSDNHLCRHHKTRLLLPRPAVYKMMKLTKVIRDKVSQNNESCGKAEQGCQDKFIYHEATVLSLNGRIHG
jgi:hypothetical protein